jgi:hypothetical protein
MRYGKVDREHAMQLATCPPEDDGPVLMVNFMKYRERASYAADAGDAAAEISGREADDRYAPLDVLKRIGARVVYSGDVVDESGGRDPMWDRVAIAMYPTRRSFIEMQARNDFKEKHVHKDAGMEFTINLTTTPMGPMAGDGDGDGDGSGVLTFVAWPEGSTPDARPDEGVMLHVEGRILGDDRRWAGIGMHYANHIGGELPAGAMVVRTTPSLDRMRETIDSWPR